jgi:quercetin dioxygenase-like cupin family protein
MEPMPVWVDLLEACHATTHSGPQWAHECEDLDMTLLTWKEGRRIEAHVNSEVDVVMIGLEGAGVVTVNGEPHEMRSGAALLIPKGCKRAVEATSERFSYLSVHRRRRGTRAESERQATSGLTED